MRNFLAIGGFVLLLILGIAAWLLWPKAQPDPLSTTVAQAAVAQESAPSDATPAAPAAQPGHNDPENTQGSLRVCNQTGNPISIALGYRAERGWQSEGWWVAQPNECKAIYTGRLDARYYYVFAADDIGGGSWDGQFFMCSRDETFTIFGVEDCLARGYERTGFFEVDTQNKPNWTLQLTDNEIVGGETGGGADGVAPLEDDSTTTQDSPPTPDAPPADNGASGTDAPMGDE